MNAQHDKRTAQLKPYRKEVYFVMNRHMNTAALFEASCFEELQGMFRVGIMMPDGTMANGIGRCSNAVQFAIKASKGGTRIQTYYAKTKEAIDFDVENSMT